MKYVYELTHEYELPADENGVIYDMGTDIAIYSSRKKALAAIERLKSHPAFKDHPDGFEIGKIEIDKDYWTEGFVVWDKRVL